MDGNKALFREGSLSSIKCGLGPVLNFKILLSLEVKGIDKRLVFRFPERDGVC